MLALLLALALSADAASLPGAAPLTGQTDYAAETVASIDSWLTREIERSPERRQALWQRGPRSDAELQRFLEDQRARVKRFFGLVDLRVPDPAPRGTATLDRPANLSPAGDLEILAIEWPALPGVRGEGLLVRAKAQPPRALVIVVPDADQSPEATLGLAAGPPRENLYPRLRELALAGCLVVVPALIDRRDEFSVVGSDRATNQPHREFLYRQAYELGRHPIGYEAQKILALVDWFCRLSDQPIGLFGHGEGGLVALVAAAADARIEAVAVAGYFGRRERVWSEPIYRNVWRQLAEFGDAELAALVAPRELIVETAAPRLVSGPPDQREGRRGAAPGAIDAPREPRHEFARAEQYAQQRGAGAALQLIEPADAEALGASLEPLVSKLVPGIRLGEPGAAPAAVDAERGLSIHDRQRRQFRELVDFTQSLLAGAQDRRRRFWSQADPRSLESWRESTAFYRDYLRDEVIGRLDRPLADPRPRARQIYDEPGYQGYEVVLDVFDGLVAQGILLVPKGLREGERRAVVVCQHGLEGRPSDVADPRVDHPAYHQFACRLAERGFITYAPQNPYVGGDRFRVLQRKANPLGLSLFSFIVRQHEQAVGWLATLPMVDPRRIAFYGLSYGGKTAMRVPPLVEGYCLAICSADFNEWIWKNASADSPYSYLATGEYEMPEFDLGNTFNYAELAGLIAPRPFMVERGHGDGVAPDEQVAYEYAKVRRLYAQLGIPERTQIEFFDGPHTIHAVGTFEFLERHLRSEPP